MQPLNIPRAHREATTVVYLNHMASRLATFANTAALRQFPIHGDGEILVLVQLWIHGSPAEALDVGAGVDEGAVLIDHGVRHWVDSGFINNSPENLVKCCNVGVIVVTLSRGNFGKPIVKFKC